jgi:hypothetical protein
VMCEVRGDTSKQSDSIIVFFVCVMRAIGVNISSTFILGQFYRVTSPFDF